MMAEEVIVRQETFADQAAVYHVEQAAFGRTGEADLVDKLRASNDCIVSIVARIGEQIVGHVWFSPVVLQGSEEWPGVGLGPLAVLPEYQKRGIGSRLVREGLGTLQSAGHDFIVVLGNPTYYGRFGFVNAANYNILCAYEVPPGVFQVIELSPGALSGKSGLILYPPPFNEV